MIPVGFEYARPDSRGRRAGAAGRARRGRQACSPAATRCCPVMKLRLAAPELLIDIGRLHELSYIARRRRRGRDRRRHPAPRPRVVRRAGRRGAAAGGASRAPSATRRCATAARSAARSRTPTRPPTCPAAVLALGGTVVLRGPRGERQVPITEFFTGMFSTAKEPDELIVEIRVPRTGGGRLGLREVRPAGQRLGDRRRSRWSTAGSGWSTWAPPRCGRRPPRPRWPTGRSIEDAAALAAEGTEPPERPRRHPRSTAATWPGSSPAAP